MGHTLATKPAKQGSTKIRKDARRYSLLLQKSPSRNIVNVTVELSSFGRPKKEKLEPHLRPLREAITTTWSKYFLGHSQPSQLGSQPSQPTIHHRQRETSDVREHPEDIHRRQRGHGRRRNGSSIASFLAITVGQQCCHGFSLHPDRRQAMLPPIQSSVTGGSFLSSVLASPHILGQPFFGLQPFTRGFPLG
ncbi:hypothetical protein Taro_013985 [Colocasia esculenta]|uniref:Uncharacterized protein n=1 Tax=Colocasia esculenta TaxID=4460 RepID=A0A843UI34_COLES|nr:hypothetical protein [Colocasia esculenta]